MNPGRQQYQPLSDALQSFTAGFSMAGHQRRTRHDFYDDSNDQERDPDQHSSEDPSSGTSHDRQSLDPSNPVAGPSHSPTHSLLGVKRKPGRPKGSKTKKRRRLDAYPDFTARPQTKPTGMSSSRKFTTASTDVPRPPSTTVIPENEKKLHEFQWRVLSLCNEFYDAALDLFSSAPEEMKDLYDLDDNSEVTPLTILNDARNACDFFLRKPHEKLIKHEDFAMTPNVPSGSATDAATSTTLEPELAITVTEDTDAIKREELPPFPSDTVAPTSVPAMADFLLTPESSPYSPLPTTGTSSSPLPHLHINQQQGAWTDEENDRLLALSENYRSATGDIDWDQVVSAFGLGRSRHQILIKATAMGLKPSSTRPSRQRQREARLAAQAAAAATATGRSSTISPALTGSIPSVSTSGGTPGSSHPPHLPTQLMTSHTPLTPSAFTALAQLSPSSPPTVWQAQSQQGPYFGGIPAAPHTTQHQALDDVHSPEHSFLWPPADMNNGGPSYDYR